MADYGIFLLQALTIVVAFLLLFGGIVAIAGSAARNKKPDAGFISVEKINDEIEQYEETLKESLLDKDVLKQQLKDKEKEEKAKAKEDKKKAKQEKKLEKKQPAKTAEAEAQESEQQDADDEDEKRVFVLDFDGDIKASDVDFMREEITAVLTMARAKDEVVVRLESGGGMVHSYGLASSQLQRIKDKGIPLTVCIDKVAASGGYMMACLADKIVAAPFAIVGSIGVVAQLPNFNKILKKHDVDFELFTAGEYKRTVTMFGENTDKAREKFQNDLEETHVLFKNHVSRFRPGLDIEAVATGDVWYGIDALDQKLIDQVGTSDDYVVEACKEFDVYQVSFEYKKSLQEKLGLAVQAGVEKSTTRFLTLLQNQYHTKS